MSLRLAWSTTASSRAGTKATEKPCLEKQKQKEEEEEAEAEEEEEEEEGKEKERKH